MFARPQLAPVRSRADVLKDATVREFDGGWNVVDNELNLSTRFAVTLDNMSREEDGSMGLRWGTERLATIDDANWIDPTRQTLAPFDAFTQAAFDDDTDITANIANTGAWHDANTAQAMTASTRISRTITGADKPDLVLYVAGIYNAGPTLVHHVIVTPPTEGWLTGTGSTDETRIVLQCSIIFGGQEIVLREQEYLRVALPKSWQVPIPSTYAAGIDQVRVRVRCPIQRRNSTLDLGVCEMRAYTFSSNTNNPLPASVYIVNHFYFQDSVVVNLSNGCMLRVLADGSMTVIWSAAIAATLVGAPSGWGLTDFVSYAVFGGKLIVCNGKDKPLLIDFTNTPPVQYLADEATGANGNVPICRYVVAMNRFLVMAGDALHPDRVHISNQDTSGTWFGDAAPNNATYVDLGKVGVQGDQDITGINRYRDQLVVAFLSASVLGKLGIFTDDTVPLHKPNFDDVIEGFGCHSHRTMVNLGNDLFMLDDPGITSIARSLYSGTTEPKRVSELIDPQINNNVNRLRESDLLLGAHAVYNSNDKQYMCFIPNYAQTSRNMITDAFEIRQGEPDVLWVHIPNHTMLVGDEFRITGMQAFNTVTTAMINGINHVVERVVSRDIVAIVVDGLVTNPSGTVKGGGTQSKWTPQWTETLGYIYTFVTELKIRAWARFRGWRWRSSCRTEFGNVIFADDRRLFLYGNQNAPVHVDFKGTTDEQPIAFAWEMPWADFDKRVNEKHTRYMQLDTVGTAPFTMMMFVDMLYQQNGLLLPNNLMTFVGGDNGGYGNNGQPYGGGRRTSDQRLYSWVARGKLFKLRFEGIVSEPLRVIAVSLLYQNGSVRR